MSNGYLSARFSIHVQWSGTGNSCALDELAKRIILYMCLSTSLIHGQSVRSYRLYVTIALHRLLVLVHTGVIRKLNNSSVRFTM